MATDLMKEGQKVEAALKQPTQHQPFPAPADKAPLQGSTVARDHIPGSTMKPPGSK